MTAPSQRPSPAAGNGQGQRARLCRAARTGRADRRRRRRVGARQLACAPEGDAGLGPPASLAPGVDGRASHAAGGVPAHPAASFWRPERRGLVAPRHLSAGAVMTARPPPPPPDWLRPLAVGRCTAVPPAPPQFLPHPGLPPARLARGVSRGPQRFGEGLTASVPPAPQRVSSSPWAAPALYEQVYGAILETLCSGLLRPGDRLNQDELAARLNVSRQPVTPTLTVLRTQAFVSDTGHCGLVAAPLCRRFFQVAGRNARIAGAHGRQAGGPPLRATVGRRSAAVADPRTGRTAHPQSGPGNDGLAGATQVTRSQTAARTWWR